jgi:hypothetical protein
VSSINHNIWYLDDNKWQRVAKSGIWLWRTSELRAGTGEGLFQRGVTPANSGIWGAFFGTRRNTTLSVSAPQDAEGVQLLWRGVEGVDNESPDEIT